MVIIKNLFIIATLVTVLTGCQSDLGKVVKGNITDNPENIDALNVFVNKVTMKDKAKITVLGNGIEGQEAEEVLTFNGKEIKVHRTIDDKFIEEFNCSGIQVNEEEEGTIVYTLQECSWEEKNQVMDYPLLSVKE
ncbi:hypothetical protein [Bacillus suaedaesalsae]|uniref:DUF4362 domain-containing protein n=1 Tax=Bacillus suaedaesalsae TaxID=2810349 RepID=A0ABS2DCM2_9BACI|nr:hypothetical protein [Bacillus suaedaesalsae]MBM6616188.1 hypothetical protein [Bacillus suaedaesalsae]